MLAASPAARMATLTLGITRKQAASSSSKIMSISSVMGSYPPLPYRRSLIVPARRRLRQPKLSARAIDLRISKAEALDRKPTMDIAKSMPRSLQELDNSSLVTLGKMGDHEANGEMLTRHIMHVDKCPYDEASYKVTEIEKKVSEYAWLEALPYRIGIGSALTAALCSFPLVFDLNTALWFNGGFVTTDVPEPHDLQTALEVGSWTWNWMEPPLGQISFVLLCLQYARGQLHNLGVKPYTRYIKNLRGQRLAGQYPDYDARFLIDFAESANLLKKW